MMKRLFIATIIWAGFLLSNAQAQVAAQHVLGNGGNVITSGDFQIGSTVGQTIVGITGSVEHGFWAASSDIITPVEELTDAELPQHFRLDANYPNPFNPSTTITYALPEGVAVRLVIYNVLGQAVRTMVNGEQSAGVYRAIWDGRNTSGASVPSGVYFYRLSAGSFTEVRRMMLVK